MSQEIANDKAVEHLLTLSKTVATKGSTYHQAIIESIGEAGGKDAVEHLLTLSKTAAAKGGTYHQAIIKAIGRAGRIS